MFVDEFCSSAVNVCRLKVLFKMEEVQTFQRFSSQNSDFELPATG